MTWPTAKPELVKSAERFKVQITEAKAAARRADFSWYPYDSLMNWYPISQLLGDKPLGQLVRQDWILDLGAADGATSFFLEHLGHNVCAVDNPGTNFNRMLGIRVLRGALQSNVDIRELDLDGRFELPDLKFGLALFLGTLYHLKNPYYALERLSQSCRWCFLSTRIARETPDSQVNFENQPMAYLLDEREANGDPTNYWIFSRAGLERILKRTGWGIHSIVTTGDTKHSDPVRSEHDERAFCLLRGALD